MNSLKLILITGLSVLLLTANTAFADSYFVGPGVDQDGNKTGNWVVYKKDSGGRLTTSSVHKTKKRAEKKAAKKNEQEAEGFKAEETGPCSEPSPTMDC